MTARARRWRLAASLGLVAALVIGTWWGDDDHFPFGPFRMYASTIDLDAPTSWLELEVVTADGETMRLSDGGRLGLRRAELEGRAGEFTAEPATLGPLLEAYLRAHPDSSAVRIRLVRWNQAMSAGRPDGPATSEVLAEWRQ